MKLFKGPAQWIIDPLGANIIISRDQQGSDAMIVPMLDTSDLNNLASSMAVGKIQTGAGITATLTIADMDIKNQMIALASNTTVITDAASKQKVVVSDLAGVALTGRKIVIKPYDGLLPSANANTWLTIMNAVISDLKGSKLDYGLKNQQMLQINFDSLPDSNGVKYILGDESAIG